MNSIGVEFEDGFRTVTARFAVRRASRASAPEVSKGARGETAGVGLKRPGASIDWRAP